MHSASIPPMDVKCGLIGEKGMVIRNWVQSYYLCTRVLSASSRRESGYEDEYCTIKTLTINRLKLALAIFTHVLPPSCSEAIYLWMGLSMICESIHNYFLMNQRIVHTQPKSQMKACSSIIFKDFIIFGCVNPSLHMADPIPYLAPRPRWSMVGPVPMIDSQISIQPFPSTPVHRAIASCFLSMFLRRT